MQLHRDALSTQPSLHSSRRSHDEPPWRSIVKIAWRFHNEKFMRMTRKQERIWRDLEEGMKKERSSYLKQENYSFVCWIIHCPASVGAGVGALTIPDHSRPPLGLSSSMKKGKLINNWWPHLVTANSLIELCDRIMANDDPLSIDRIHSLWGQEWVRRYRLFTWQGDNF